MELIRLIINNILLRKSIFKNVKEIHNQLIESEKVENSDEDDHNDKKLVFKWEDIQKNICLEARFGYLKLFKIHLKEQEQKYSRYTWFKDNNIIEDCNQKVDYSNNSSLLKSIKSTLLFNSESTFTTTSTTTTTTTKKKTFVPYLERYIERACKGDHLNIIKYLYKRYGKHIGEVSYYIYKWSFHYHRYHIFSYLLDIDFNQLYVGIILESHYKHIQTSEMNVVPKTPHLEKLIVKCLEFEDALQHSNTSSWPSVIYPGWLGLLSEVDHIKKYFPLMLNRSYTKETLQHSVQFASRYGNVKALDVFVNTFSIPCDRQSLEWAMINGQTDAVAYIVENYNVTSPFNKLLPPFKWNHIYTNICQEGHLEVLKFINQHHSPSHEFNLSLSHACDNGHIELVKYLVEETNLPLDLIDGINVASGNGNLTLVKYLTIKLETIEQKRNIYEKSEDLALNNAFTNAIIVENADILTYLVNIRPNTFLDEIGLEYLTITSKQEIFDIVKDRIKIEMCKSEWFLQSVCFLPFLTFIKEKSPKLLIPKSDNWSIPILYTNESKITNYFDVFYFLTQFKESNHQDYTVEMGQAILHRHLEVVKWIDKNGSTFGSGFLVEVASSNSEEIFNIICSSGRYHCLNPIKEVKALEIAIQNGNHQMVKYLIETVGMLRIIGPPLNLIKDAIESLNVEVLSYLIDQMKKTRTINQIDQGSLHATVSYCKRFSKDIIDCLISSGLLRKFSLYEKVKFRNQFPGLVADHIITMCNYKEKYTLNTKYNDNIPFNSDTNGITIIDGLIAFIEIDHHQKRELCVDVASRVGDLDQIRFLYFNTKNFHHSDRSIEYSLNTSHKNVSCQCHVARFLLDHGTDGFLGNSDDLSTYKITSPHVAALLSQYPHLEIIP